MKQGTVLSSLHDSKLKNLDIKQEVDNPWPLNYSIFYVKKTLMHHVHTMGTGGEEWQWEW